MELKPGEAKPCRILVILKRTHVKRNIMLSSKRNLLLEIPY
jgi:hypothetical protein